MASPSDVCDADCRSVEAEIMGGCTHETAADARKARMATEEEEDSRHAYASTHAEAHAEVLGHSMLLPRHRASRL
jgi:hypothetical protein